MPDGGRTRNGSLSEPERSANSIRTRTGATKSPSRRGEDTNSKIVDLIDYSCDVTLAFLSGCLADESRMTFENLRETFLDPVGSSEVPVPINDMMVATFALTFLDIGHRVIAGCVPAISIGQR